MLGGLPDPTAEQPRVSRVCKVSAQPWGAEGPTDASLVRSSSAATRATLEMMGATLVGP